MLRAILLVLIISLVAPYNAKASYTQKVDSEGIVVEFIGKNYVTNYTDSVVFKVNLTNKSTGEPIGGVNVSFYIVISGQKQFIGVNKTTSNGLALFRIESVSYSPGRYYVNASATYKGYYSEAKAEFIINKETTQITLLTYPSVEYSDSLMLEARLTTDDDEKISNVKLELNFLGEVSMTLKATTDNNGVAKFNISTVSEGMDIFTTGLYNFIISFAGNDNYFGSSIKDTLNVSEEEMAIYVSTIGKLVVGSSIVMVIKVRDNDNTPVQFAEIRIFINDQIVGVGRTDSEGIYEFTWTPNNGGKHNIKIVALKENYLNASYEFTLDIEEEGGEGGGGSLLLVVLAFLIIAVIVAVISRRRF